MLCCILLIGTFQIQSAQGDLIAYEDFDPYTVNSALAGQSGGSGFAGNWLGEVLTSNLRSRAVPPADNFLCLCSEIPNRVRLSDLLHDNHRCILVNLIREVRITRNCIEIPQEFVTELQILLNHRRFGRTYDVRLFKFANKQNQKIKKILVKPKGQQTHFDTGSIQNRQTMWLLGGRLCAAPFHSSLVFASVFPESKKQSNMDCGASLFCDTTLKPL